MRDAKGSWFGQSGHADTGTGRERSAGAHFRGASITKTFATVLLQLEAEGRLDLDDTVEHWLPVLVHGDGYDGNKVTLRQLLNRTSGIAHYTDDAGFSHDSAGPGFPEHRYAEIHDATEQNMTWMGAAGDVISTGGDLNRFHRAPVKGHVLPPRQMKEMFEEVPAGHGIGYGLGVEFARLSCGVKAVGKSGRTNGSLPAMVGTQDGEHQLTFNINGDWLPDSLLYTDVIEAEFCGKVPSRTDRAPAAPRLG